MRERRQRKPLERAQQIALEGGSGSRELARQLSGGRMRWGIGLVLLLAAVGSRLALRWGSSGFEPRFEKAAARRVEVRVMGADGQPAPAIDVFVNDSFVGVTDSYGEWRRYLRLAAGDTFKVSIQGELGGRATELVRNLAVPLIEPGEADSQQVRVLFQVGRDVAAPVRREEPATPDPEAALAEANAMFGRVQVMVPRDVHHPTERARLLSIGRNLIRNLEAAGIRVDQAEAPWQVILRVLPVQSELASAVRSLLQVENRWGIGAENTVARLLPLDLDQDDIGEKLVRFLQLSTPVSHLMTRDDRSGQWYIRSPDFSFWQLVAQQALRGANEETFRVSERLIPGRRQWVEDDPAQSNRWPCGQATSPCVLRSDYPTAQTSTVAGWEMVRVQLPQLAQEGSSQVYVGGIPFRSQRGGVFVGPGQPGQRVYLSVVQDHAIVLRQLVEPQPLRTRLAQNL